MKKTLSLLIALVICIPVITFAANGQPFQDLQNQINTQSTATTATDQQLQNQINAEAAARSAADQDLMNKISNEAATRNAADQEVLGQINVEAAARSAADNNLQNQINSLQQQVTDLKGMMFDPSKFYWKSGKGTFNNNIAPLGAYLLECDNSTDILIAGGATCNGSSEYLFDSHPEPGNITTLTPPGWAAVCFALPNLNEYTGTPPNYPPLQFTIQPYEIMVQCYKP